MRHIDWHIQHPLYSQVTFLRKSHGSRLNVFAPINDLSALSKTGAADRALLPSKQGDLTVAGGQILGDEYSDHVVKVDKVLNADGGLHADAIIIEPQWYHSTGRVGFVQLNSCLRRSQ